MKGKISKRSVDALKAGQFLWDNELRGFGVKCTPAGKRVFLVQYRLPSDGSPDRPRDRTAPRRYTIGAQSDALPPDEARRRAAKVLAAASAGEDPRAALARLRATPTLREFSATYHEKRESKSKRAPKKPRSVAEDNRNLRLHILPALGDKKLTSITTDDVEEFHSSMDGTPVGANRCLALLSHMFAVAMASKDMPRGPNPCKGIEKYPERGRERFLNLEELTRLGDALNASAGQEHSSALSAIRLLVLTGCRLKEILTLQWAWVDLDGRRLRLPDSKTGRKHVPLAEPAIELLRALPRERGNPHVLPGEREGRHIVGIQRPWQRIRARADLAGVRIHDLRHSFASVAVESGESLLTVGKILGHSRPSTTERYAHLSLDPLKGVADRVGEKIAGAMPAPPKDGGVVVSYPKRRSGRRAP